MSIHIEDVSDGSARIVQRTRNVETVLGTVERMTLNYSPAPGQMASRERWVPVGPEAVAFSDDVLAGLAGEGFADRAGAIDHLVHRGDQPPARVAPSPTRKNTPGRTTFGLSAEHGIGGADCTCGWQWVDADGIASGNPGVVLQAAREHAWWEHSSDPKHVDITDRVNALLNSRVS